MKLRPGFLIFNYLLTGLALYCLTSSQVFSPDIGFVLGSALLLCFILEVKKVIPLKAPVKIVFSSGGLLALPLLHFGLDLPLVPLLVWVLVFLLFSRLIFKSELNDYLFGYLLSIVCLLIGAVYIQDLTFAFIFFAFFLALCWGLIFYNMMADRVGSHSPPEIFKQMGGDMDSPSGGLFGLSAGLLLLGLVVTTLAFMGFPRLGSGFFPSGPSLPMSGFSENVRIGDIGRIQQNSGVVMRVEYTQNETPYRPQMPVFWRGVVLDHFDGAYWTSTVKSKWKLSNRPGFGTQLFPFDANSKIVKQTIFVDAMESSVIFTQGIPLFVDGNFWRLQMDLNFAMRTLDRTPGPKTVTLISDLQAPQKSQHREIFNADSKRLHKKFLQLPPLSANVLHLADTLTENSASEKTTAENILNHLRTHFGYTLDLGDSPGSSGLDTFLFQRKEGHCEYFASAMVVLLRLAGIPARLVNGFVGAEWNELGEYMVVRQHHAHSWVEAYLPEAGWTVYDPTPADPAAVENRFDNSITRALDLIQFNWQRYIVRYSMNDQVEMLDRLKTQGQDALGKLSDFRSLNGNDLEAFFKSNRNALIFLCVLIAGGLLARNRSTGRTWFGSSQPLFPVWLYEEMLKRLQKTGIKKQPHWSHREFLNRLPALPEEKLNLIHRITAFYEKARFGQSPVLDTEKKELLNTLRKI